jgi:hypothetical protein
MKNQYFGDVNDYRKYGLLRHLDQSGFKRIAIAWMLTPDDGSSDGRFRAYLDAPARFAGYDPHLYDTRRSLLSDVRPAVGLLEGTALLSSAFFYSAPVPDRCSERMEWRRGLFKAAGDAELVFVDPDNGIEVKSRPIGRKGSSKYVAWDELTGLWQAGYSILVYQHFRREERGSFARRLAAEFAERTGAGLVEAFRTPHVLFLLAAQNRHACVFHRAHSISQWAGHIDVMGLAKKPQ